MKLDKLIINAAITGILPTKRDNPHVPISAEEIVAEAKRCRDAGASILHIHARDANGQQTYQKEIIADIFAGIREVCPDLLISGTTSGRTHKELWQRSQVLELVNRLKPDFASLTLGSLNFPTQASVNDPKMIQDLATMMKQRGIVPELELFDLGMMDYALYLIDRGILAPPYYANVILGSLGTLAATPHNLTTMVRALPPGTTWSAAGIGRFQFYVNTMAIVMGGHVRVGLEDNLWYDNERTKLATNAGLIERLVKITLSVGRKIASPEEAREIIGMPAPASILADAADSATT